MSIDPSSSSSSLVLSSSAGVDDERNSGDDVEPNRLLLVRTIECDDDTVVVPKLDETKGVNASMEKDKHAHTIAVMAMVEKRHVILTVVGCGSFDIKRLM
uniref:Uncharacterized protein n=1 Tax=Ditylum brightwellii TaxID=49249 RepID=A0A7S4W207_9STRA